MKFKFKNLGFIKEGEIDLSNLTIICGDNNRGKTYLSYAIYGFYEAVLKKAKIELSNIEVNRLLKNKKINLKLDLISKTLFNETERLSRDFSQNIYKTFGATEKMFVDTNIYFTHINNNLFTKLTVKHDSTLTTKINIDINGLSISINNNDNELTPEDIKSISSVVTNIPTNFLWDKAFPITSERTGAALFYKDLDKNRSHIVDSMIREGNFNVVNKLDGLTSNYALPIQHNIDFIRDYENLKKNKSFLLENDNREYKELFTDWAKLLDGSFDYSDSSPHFITSSKISVPLHNTSAGVKSLFILDAYLKHSARKGDLLLIDEPELNLHPSRQIMLARVLARLTNLGVKVLITTHSDYIVRELSNLVMLSGEFKEKETLLKRYDYSPGELLAPENVSACTINAEGVIEQLEVDRKGIAMDVFDKAMIRQNNISDDIYYSLEE